VCENTIPGSPPNRLVMRWVVVAECVSFESLKDMTALPSCAGLVLPYSKSALLDALSNSVATRSPYHKGRSTAFRVEGLHYTALFARRIRV
jgi:hypothetical protein